MDSNKHSHSDKNLVTDQPGMTILVAGFVIAFLLGYTTKSFTSPARVTARLEKAASHIHKDVKVNFTSAHFSLSDGILPRLAVVVSQVHMESSNVCWGAPILEVDELRLPISFWALVTGKNPLRDIQANIVSLRLREDLSHCDKKKKQNQELGAKSPLVSLTPSETSAKYRDDIRGMTIRKFQFFADKYPQYQPELLNFVVKVKSFEPRVIEVTAKSHLLKDSAVGDYLSHANLYVQYKESPDKALQVHFFGNWREGHYSVIGNYLFEEEYLALETDLKHIPLTQVLAMAQKYNLTKKALNGRQVWISSKARLSSKVSKLKSSPLELRDILLEGDLGEMRVDSIAVSSLQPLTYQPIYIDVQKLDIEKLLVFLNKQKKSTRLGNLGKFSGRAEIKSDKQMKMSGELTGLEFVFSNKGQQELQVIDTVVGEFALTNEQWNFNIQRVEPRGGVFIGDLNVKADRNFQDVNVKTHIDELTFAAPVQKLMTNGGNVGVLSFDADVNLKEGELSYLKGLLRVDTMEVEGVAMEKSRVTFNWHKNELLMNTKVKNLRIAQNSPAAPVMKQVTWESWWPAGILQLQNLEGELKMSPDKSLSWKSFQGSFGSGGKLSTQGGWNENGTLRGLVTAKDGKLSQEWEIQGTREMPQFNIEKASFKGK